MDLVRTVAIALVILVHATFFPYRIPGPGITSMDVVNWFSSDVYAAFGYVGVPLFVLLAGALLLDPAKAEEPLRAFFKKRWNRIGIPFIVWTIVYFLWSFEVDHTPITLYNISKGLANGSYAHLWFLYLLVGLYAVTPMLRVLVKHLDRRLFGLLLVLWFAGTLAPSFINTFAGPDFNFNPVMFVFTGWVGFFLLGIYLVKVNMKRSTIIGLGVFGMLGSILGDWALTAAAGEKYTGYFHNYMSFGIIIGSAAIFLLLLSFPPAKIESHSKFNRALHWVSQNTLPIYLIHIIVIQTLTFGPFFGVWLNNILFVPLVDAPAFAVIVFTVSCALVYGLKKIPYMKKLIG